MARRRSAALLLILSTLLVFPACNGSGGGGGGGGGPGTGGAGPPPADPCGGLPPDVCDADGDGHVELRDVCRAVPDLLQCDSDADGYGNACDCDLDQDGACDAVDAALFDAALGSPGFGVEDMDCDADVDADDEALFDAAFQQGAPGPSGLACAGSEPCPDDDRVFPGTQFATASPAAEGFDPDALQDALDFLAAVSGNDGIDETLVIAGGHAIWEGPDVARVHNSWSVTKSFTATAMGLLLGDGSATFDTRAADLVPELAPQYPTVTLRHFVTHGSGYDAVGGSGSSTPFDPVPPLFTPPGSRFLYWDAAINQLANVLTRIADESLAERFARDVADPIGMPPAEWSWGDFGSQDGLRIHGGAGNRGRGIHTNARTLARFCLLHLARGRWNGVQVVPSEWVANATRTRVPYTVPDLAPGGIGPGAYGHGWFANGFVAAGVHLWPDAPAGAYMAAGFNQNRCWVVPEWDLVVVRMGTHGGGYDPADENEFLRLLGLARR